MTPPRRIGKYERLASERNEKDLALTRQPGGHPRGLWFNDAEADRAVDFIQGFCRHYKGEWVGQPLKLEEWARWVVRCIFGWMRADGTRRFRTAWEEIARKNGKTTKAAGGALYMLAGDGEPGSEVYCTATKEKQAWILHDDATNMVEHSADLRQVVAIARHNLSCERLGSKFEPLGADSDTLDGLNPHAHFPDEVHAHKDPGVWIKLDTAMGSRRQPLTWAITTAGVYDKESVGWQKHQYAVDVLEGTVDDDEFFAFICALDEDDDAFDPANWGKANPNLGVSIYESFMHGQAKKAQHDPGFFNDYLQLHHNRWTQQVKRWILPAKWAALHEGPPAMRSEWDAALVGRACFGGLDLSSKNDLTALVLAFRGSDDVIDFICRFWIPEARVEEEAKKKRKHYQRWVEDGWLIATPGQRVDYEFIRKEINELGQKFRIEQIAFDPWNAGSIVTQLQDTDGFLMVETRQGFASLSDPSKDFEARIGARQIRHGGHPVLAWNVGNAVTTSDPAGNIKPDKSKAKDKIDGVIAAIMALGRANLREESVYSGERGFQSL